MQRITVFVSFVLCLSCASTSTARLDAAAASGTRPRGSIVIGGGGQGGAAMTQKFIVLAGGAGRARVLVLPMASSLPETGQESVDEFRKDGVAAWAMNLTRGEAMREET